MSNPKIVQKPANSVQNYIEMAVENVRDERTRQKISRPEDASRSLSSAMDDLIKITKVENITSQSNEETFNLSQTGMSHYQDGISSANRV